MAREEIARVYRSWMAYKDRTKGRCIHGEILKKRNNSLLLILLLIVVKNLPIFRKKIIRLVDTSLEK